MTFDPDRRNPDIDSRFWERNHAGYLGSHPHTSVRFRALWQLEHKSHYHDA